jgi:hypothetical protein
MPSAILKRYHASVGSLTSRRPARKLQKDAIGSTADITKCEQQTDVLLRRAHLCRRNRPTIVTTVEVQQNKHREAQ